MLKYSLDALVDSNLDAADRVKKLDGEVDKIYYLILRQLFTAVRNPIIAESLKIERPLNIVGDRAVAQLIEDIGDTCHNSCTKFIAFSQTASLPKELQPKAQELQCADSANCMTGRSELTRCWTAERPTLSSMIAGHSKSLSRNLSEPR